MNYPELLTNEVESIPSSWSSNSSGYQPHVSLFSPSFLETLKLEDENDFNTIHPSVIYHHSPQTTTISSPDHSNLFNLQENKIYSNNQQKNLIQHYLSTKQGEKKVTILTSKVAQKSYGNEKRQIKKNNLILLFKTHSFFHQILMSSSFYYPFWYWSLVDSKTISSKSDNSNLW
jgi:hypothetical protein